MGDVLIFYAPHSCFMQLVFFQVRDEAGWIKVIGCQQFKLLPIWHVRHHANNIKNTWHFQKQIKLLIAFPHWQFSWLHSEPIVCKHATRIKIFWLLGQLFSIDGRFSFVALY
jgi:hypothetical protein